MIDNRGNFVSIQNELIEVDDE